MDGASAETTHDLLLALAGWVDDDLLTWARELVAVDETRNAVELLTATLVADQVELPEETRAAVVAAGRTTRTELDADTTLAPHRATIGTSHRFDGGPADAVVDALCALPARLLVDCRASLARRLTPAGSAPGPLPHPVVLIEVTAGSRNRDVLAYQLADALNRAGVGASVEVLTTGDESPAYHAEALRSAQPVRSGEPGSAEPSSNRSTTSNGSSGGPPPRPVPVRAGARAGSSLGGAPDGSGATSSAEPDRAPDTATAARSDAAGSHTARSGPAGSDPASSHTARSGPAGSDPAGSDPAGSNPGSDPAGSHPAGSHPAGSDTAGSGPTGSDPARSDPARSDPARSNPASSETAASGTDRSHTTGSGPVTRPPGVRPGPHPVTAVPVPGPAAAPVATNVRALVQPGASDGKERPAAERPQDHQPADQLSADQLLADRLLTDQLLAGQPQADRPDRPDQPALADVGYRRTADTEADTGTTESSEAGVPDRATEGGPTAVPPTQLVPPPPRAVRHRYLIERLETGAGSEQRGAAQDNSTAKAETTRIEGSPPTPSISGTQPLSARRPMAWSDNRQLPDRAAADPFIFDPSGSRPAPAVSHGDAGDTAGGNDDRSMAPATEPQGTGPRPTPAGGTPRSNPSAFDPLSGELLRPDSMARLSDSGRELLARLQAELRGAPQAGQRAGGLTANGGGTGPQRKVDPPDLAG